MGNRLRRTGQGLDAVFDAANRLVDDDTFLYAYDHNGNLIERTTLATGDIMQYTYDVANRLVQVQTVPDELAPPAQIVTYRYDGVGRRIEKQVDGVITRYVYDQEDILLAFDGNDVLTARYTHGPGIDEPLSLERASQRVF